MWKYNLKILFRNLQKKTLYTSISMLGFTFALTAALFIYFWVADELSFEKFHPDHNRIYRVLTLAKNDGKFEKSASSYDPLAASMRRDFPQLENATVISTGSEDSPLKIENTEIQIESRGAYADDAFFDVFAGFKFVEGDKETAFGKLNNVVLSEKVARKLFGDKSALGQTLINDKYFRQVYKVSGVVRIPAQSHIDFGHVLSTKSEETVGESGSWFRKTVWTRTYIKLRKDALVDDSFRSLASNQVGKYSRNTDKLLFQPIDDIHLYSDYQNFTNDKKISDIKYVWIFSGLALLIVFMAAFNFASLSTARASERITEIGVRKVNGAGKRKMAFQFISESVVQTFIATLIAFIVVLIFLPWFGNISGKEFSYNLTFSLIGSVLLIAVLVGCISGIYPAMVLVTYNPIEIFKGGNPTGSKSGFVSGLVLVQFAITFVLLASTAIVYKQLQFIRNRDLGVLKDNIVVVSTGLFYSNESLKQELLDNPYIVSVSAGTKAIDDYNWEKGFHYEGGGVNYTIKSTIFWVDEDYAETYGVEMVKGEFLRQNYSDYWKQHEEANKARKQKKKYTMSFPVVVNESFVRAMNIDDPIGLRLNRTHVIIGVVKDFHFRSLHHKISPLVLTNDPQCIQELNVRIRPENRAEALEYIRTVYQKHRDQRGFSYSFFEDELEQTYRAENQMESLVSKCSILSIVIAMMGILGLASFATERRFKEIGIRKVNGAKNFEILVLLNWNVLRWVLGAIALATPISIVVMQKWMHNFAYKTSISWWLYALVALLVMSLSIITVSLQSWRAATCNPVKALRYE